MQPELGRRERNKQEKLVRIIQAAQQVFATQGYIVCTTKQIAEQADISHGTLFRYVATKAELLLLVFNNYFAHALASGLEKSKQQQQLVDKICSLIEPIFDDPAIAQNIPHYQQAILSEDPNNQYCAKALELVLHLQNIIAKILLDYAKAKDTETHSAQLAAQTIYATLHILIVKTGRQGLAAQPLITQFRAHTALITSGYLAQFNKGKNDD